MKSHTILLVILLLAFSAPAFAAEEEADTVVTVYYFHGDRRCSTCRKIEKYTEQAVTENFPDAVESGRLRYRAVNTDREENEHYRKDYNLYTKSVILSLTRGGEEVQYKNLNRVWEYIRNREKFFEYITGETEAFLAADAGKSEE
jgi:hypothetical protein